MGKCPRCPWKGSAKAFPGHFARTHFRGRKKKGKAGKVKVFKTPGFAKGKRR